MEARGVSGARVTFGYGIDEGHGFIGFHYDLADGRHIFYRKPMRDCAGLRASEIADEFSEVARKGSR